MGPNGDKGELGDEIPAGYCILSKNSSTPENFNYTGHSILTNNIGTWTKGTPMPVGLSEVCVFSNKDFIYIFGGSAGEGYRSINYKYDINSGTWEELSTLPYIIGMASCVELNGGIHIVGGEDGSLGFTTRHLRFDIESNSWEEKASYPVTDCWRGIGDSETFRINNKLYVTGGRSCLSVAEPIYEYDHIRIFSVNNYKVKYIALVY